MTALVDDLRAGIPAYDVTADGIELHDIDAAETLMSAAAAELTTLQSRLEAVEAERDAAKRQLREAEAAVAERDDDRMRLVRQRDLAEIKRADTERMYEAQNAAADARVEELQKALEPFAKLADHYVVKGVRKDLYLESENGRVFVDEAWFRRARALSPARTEEGKP